MSHWRSAVLLTQKVQFQLFESLACIAVVVKSNNRHPLTEHSRSYLAVDSTVFYSLLTVLFDSQILRSTSFLYTLLLYGIVQYGKICLAVKVTYEEND